MNRGLTKKMNINFNLLKDKRLDKLSIFIVLIGFILSIYTYTQYKLTIIKLEYIVAAYIVSGLVFAILTLKYKEKLLGNEFNIFRHFFWTMFLYGSIFTGIFYLTNRQFADNEEYESSFQILERHIAYRRQPNYTVINIQNFTKNINFPDNKMTELNNANYVTLTLCNGLWGFPIIKNSKLTTQ